MKPGDVILTKKLRCYSGMKVLLPGVPEYIVSRAEPGQLIALIALGSVPKGAKVDGMAGLSRLGFVPREGYPNPSRFNVGEYNEKCLEAAQAFLDKAPACPSCTGHPKAEDSGTQVQIRCESCDSTVGLLPQETYPNTMAFAMEAARAWMAAQAAVKENEAKPAE